MPNQNQIDLIQALQDGNINKCFDLIDICDVNFSYMLFTDCRLVTPLHLAVENPQLIDVARALISEGADIEACDDENRTPLICAAIKRNQAAVTALIDKGANVQAVDKGGYSAKDYAACPRHDDIATLLEKKSFPTLFSTLALQISKQNLGVNALPEGLQEEVSKSVTTQTQNQNATDSAELNFQANLDILRKRFSQL